MFRFGSVSSPLFANFMLARLGWRRAFASARMGRAERGLYAGRGLGFGNTISDFGNRNRRTWKPNVRHASLFSELLDRKVRLRVTTEALRRIDHVGGLDNYILNQSLPESECARRLKETLINIKLRREGGNEPE